jgi:hypothetical protein
MMTYDHVAILLLVAFFFGMCAGAWIQSKVPTK